MATSRNDNVLNGGKAVRAAAADNETPAEAPAPEKKNPAGSPG
jgi:hypothetical protein